MAAMRSQEYPDSQVKVLDVPVFDRADVEAYLESRLQAHIEAQDVLPECTPEEKWERPERWALMKKGAKRAIKLYDTEAQASAAVSDPKQFVEQRPGEWVRCHYYCTVSAYCSTFREHLMEKAA